MKVYKCTFFIETIGTNGIHERASGKHSMLTLLITPVLAISACRTVAVSKLHNETRGWQAPFSAQGHGMTG